MKITDLEQEKSAISYAGIIEKIEIIRSTLRWASKLDRDQIQKLLNQCNTLREQVLQLSHKERFVKASAAGESSTSKAAADRRKALIEREFVFDGVFGENTKLLEALEIAEKAAPTNLPVLIDGESGTGKELIARVIHANGLRSEQPLVSVNCGAIPENLVESELFGHTKGAFTGASQDRKGKFETAHNGTIFLDEIGELPLNGQVKLLRVLQDHEIQRVGSDKTMEVDTRIVAATNRDLRNMADEGRFREDLFYRLSMIQVTVPPLRDRHDEIPLLVEFFSDEAAENLNRRPFKLSARLRRFLMNYSYPGNIRELRNIIFRISCLAGDIGDTEHLPESIRPKSPLVLKNQKQIQSTETLSDLKKAASDEAERIFLEQGLDEVSGRVSELAKRIDMNRSHLQTLLKKHGLRSKDFRKKAEAVP